MTKSNKEHTKEPFKVKLPGFIKEEEIGLGDVVKKVTSAIGIKPCAGCEKRAEAMNRFLVLYGILPK